MFGGSGKKGFVRTKVSATEKTLSYLMLVLIAAVGIAVYLKGQSFDPALFSLDRSELAAVQPVTSRTVADESELLYEGEYEGEVRSEPSAGPQAPPSPDLLSNISPAGWKALGGIEYFTAETLYEKINGRAEQYLAYEVADLTFAGLVAGDNDAAFIDVFVYDMGETLNAFGIYSIERAAGQPAVDLGREGYRAEASIFFCKGSYYVQVITSESGDRMKQAGLAVASTVASRLEDTGEAIWGYDLLPAEGRIAGTLQYYLKDALSLHFLVNTSTARYRQDGAEVAAFVSDQGSADAASKALSSYASYIERYGSVAGRRDVKGTSLLAGDMGGAFDIVFQEGTLVGGVSMASDRAAGEGLAARLLQHLQDR
ncbi:MAG: hypothetical protein QGI83_20300 [Candidatus Latescibacteria bacterium]|jgi:hypothetical protein|nr:hypothetical protein [Candidatus Latescibacterota bacterium]